MVNYGLILYKTCVLYKHENFNHGKYHISLTGEEYHLDENNLFFTPQILRDLTTMNCDRLMRGREATQPSTSYSIERSATLKTEAQFHVTLFYIYIIIQSFYFQ